MERLISAQKRLFRVGLNEGIILSRDTLRDYDLFTDGLSGCVALAVSNEDYLFVAHVFSGSDPKTIYDRVGNYHNDIVGWMYSNG